MLDTLVAAGANCRGDGLEAVLLPDGPGDEDFEGSLESTCGCPKPLGRESEPCCCPVEMKLHSFFRRMQFAHRPCASELEGMHLILRRRQ